MPRTIIALSVIVVAELLVFVPAALYLPNAGEFAAPLQRILPVYALAALPVMLVLLTVAWSLAPRYRAGYAALLATLVILVWMQANLLVWDYGLLNGEPILWQRYRWQGWLDAGLWLSAIVLAIRHAHACLPVLVRACVALALLQSAILVSALAMADASPAPSGPDSTDTLSETLRFSARDNVLHIVLDGLQSDIFEDIVNEPQSGPLFREALSGFTFYREHSGAFPTTYMSIPAYMGARIYENSVPKREFMRTTMASHSILRQVDDAGYAVDLVGPTRLLDYYRDGPHRNAYAIPPGFPGALGLETYTDAALLLDLALFRMAPHYLKRVIYNDQKWRLTPLLTQSEQTGFSYFSHTAFVRWMAQGLRADRDVPVYKLLHLMSTHWPMVVDRQCRLKAAPYMTSRASASAQARCTLAALAELFESMRRAGVYDDALIVLMADHGAQLPPPRFAPQRTRGNVLVDPWIAAQATPLLAVKNKGADRGFVVSDAPSQIIDVPATIAAELGLAAPESGVPVGHLSARQTRERRFYVYEWNRQDWQSAYANDIQEFVITGSVYTGDWRLGRGFLAPGAD